MIEEGMVHKNRIVSIVLFWLENNVKREKHTTKKKLLIVMTKI